MMKKIIYLILLFYFTSFSQTKDSLNIKFESNIEKEVIYNYIKDSITVDYIKSLLAIDSTITKEKIDKIKLSINNFIKKLPNKKEEKTKKEIKRVKKIYDLTHNKYLKKYNVETYFLDIFKSGDYNCVTASSLYAYIFNKLKIPYNIKDEPTHVYIIAYPETHNIYIETTVPREFNSYNPSEAEIKKIVDNLTENKLVSKEELESKGYKKAYTDYFFDDKFLNTNELIGVQYYNKAVFALNNLNYKNAYLNIKKAHIFYKKPIVKHLKKAITIVLISKKDLSNIEDIKFIKNSLSELNIDTDFTKDNLKSLLYKIVSNDDNNIESIKTIAEEFNTISNTRIKKISTEFLYDYIAETYVKQNDLNPAINYAKKSLDINPKSKLAKEVIT